jgi:hypothetical protein
MKDRYVNNREYIEDKQDKLYNTINSINGLDAFKEKYVYAFEDGEDNVYYTGYTKIWGFFVTDTYIVSSCHELLYNTYNLEDLIHYIKNNIILS